MASKFEHPTAQSGVVTKLTEVGFCMDGATHLIHTITGATRLKGLDEGVAKLLDKVADGKTHVMVMGYPAWGSECMYVSVYRVALTEEVGKAFVQDWRPWPWLTA